MKVAASVLIGWLVASSAYAAEDPVASRWRVKEDWIEERISEFRHRRTVLERRYGETGHDVNFVDPSAPPLRFDLRIRVVGVPAELREVDISIDELPPQTFELLAPELESGALWQSLSLAAVPRGGRQVRLTLRWREAGELRAASAFHSFFLDFTDSRRILDLSLRNTANSGERILAMQELKP